MTATPSTPRPSYLEALLERPVLTRPAPFPARELVAVRGMDLRHAVLVALDACKGRTLLIPEILDELARLGVRVDAERPRKALADAMRWEVNRGRAIRESPGAYRIGYLPRTTRWRARQTVRAALAVHPDLLSSSSPPIEADLAPTQTDLPQARRSTSAGSWTEE